MLGRLTHQKRIRKLIRMLSFSAGIHVVVWEECYWRWRALNDLIISTLDEAASDGADSIRSHTTQQEQVCRLLSLDVLMFMLTERRL
jgi:hypothetical protein